MTFDLRDPDQFARAFARHGRTLWVLGAAWVGRGEASDLVQEAARVAWQRRRAFAPRTTDGDGDLRAWLAQIARHVGANWRRQRRPEPRSHDALPDGPAAPTATVTGVWPFDADGCGLDDELARALEALTETARACLLLHVVLGHSFAEVGALLDLPENTAASHARRARERLHAALAKPIRNLG